MWDGRRWFDDSPLMSFPSRNVFPLTVLQGSLCEFRIMLETSGCVVSIGPVSEFNRTS